MDGDGFRGNTARKPHGAVTEGKGGGLAEEGGLDDERTEREGLEGRHCAPSGPMRAIVAAHPTCHPRASGK